MADDAARSQKAPTTISAKAVPAGESSEDAAVRAAADAALATVATRAMSGPKLPATHLCLEHVEYTEPWSAAT